MLLVLNALKRLKRKFRMVDPNHITDYRRSTHQLEELALFCLAVAGKNAITTSRALDRLLIYASAFANKGATPFEAIRKMDDVEEVAVVMKDHGFGCYNMKSKGLVQLARSGLNLRTCSAADLEKILGIGMKTSRFFILHTRLNAQVACLDTHVLQWLAYYTGYDVPKQTPIKTKYLELEKVFLELARIMKVSPADLDLKIWRRQRGSDEESLDRGISSKRNKVVDG